MTSDLQLAWAGLLFRSLERAGVRDVVLSPGSRSTPLALAASTSGMELHPVLDERAAGFFALGQARVTARPSVLVCTSGTAPAHYLPAVIEAKQAHLPLIVVSADRPWELRDVGAPQTIDQLKLFGDHVHHFAELGPPEPKARAFRAVARIGAQLVHRATWPSPGPVHLNVQLRKPLEPFETARPAWRDDLDEVLRDGGPHIPAPVVTPNPDAVGDLAAKLRSRARIVFACGPAPASFAARGAEVARLAERCGAVVLAEATSQVRPTPGAAVCTRFDVFLRDAALRAELAPDLVLELHGTLTSSAFAAYLDDHPGAIHVVASAFELRDASTTASEVLLGDPEALVQALHAALGSEAVPDSESARRFRARFAEREARVRAVHARVPEVVSPLTDGAVARAVVATLGADTTLMVGNSSPIRDVDGFGEWSGREGNRVLHQRGANGIDGLLAGAAGAFSASSGDVTAFVGDVSALCDVGSVALIAEVARRHPTRRLSVVVANNRGGRLFEQLPVATRGSVAAERVEALFVMPHEHSLADLAAGFGVASVRVSTRAELERALAGSVDRNGDLPRAAVIEAVVSPEASRDERRRVARECAEEQPGPRPGQLTLARSRRGGEPPARLVLLHGFLGGPSMWEATLDHLDGAEAWVGRLPGHGAEGPLGDPDAAEREARVAWDDGFAWACDALAAELAALPESSSPTVLVGYSMGARLALGLSARHPRAIGGLVLIGVHPGLETQDARADRGRWEDALVETLERDGLAAFGDAWGREGLFSTQRGLPDAELARQRRERRRHDAPRIAWAIRALGLSRMPNLSSTLLAPPVPTWIVVGERDEKFRAIARGWDRLPAVRVVVVPGVGHNVALEAPAALAGVLREATCAGTERGAEVSAPEAGAPKRIPSAPSLG